MSKRLLTVGDVKRITMTRDAMLVECIGIADTDLRIADIPGEDIVGLYYYGSNVMYAVGFAEGYYSTLRKGRV